MDPDDVDAISHENEKLINQLLEFTDEMETRIVFLKKKDKLNVTQTSIRSNPDLQEKMNKLSTQAQKIKFMKEETN